MFAGWKTGRGSDANTHAGRVGGVGWRTGRRQRRFWCEASDDALVLSVEGGLSRGIPGPPFNFAGSLAVKVPGTQPDFRDIALAEDDLAQSWFDGDEIRLQIYRERPEGLFASLDLVIETTIDPGDELSYVGTYTLVTSGMTAGASEADGATGPVTCSAG